LTEPHADQHFQGGKHADVYLPGKGLFSETSPRGANAAQQKRDTSIYATSTPFPVLNSFR
jgi:hypothetical protein